MVKNFPVGLQLYSVRDDMVADVGKTLEKVKAMGYDGVEFAGLFDRDPGEIKALCEKYGLVPVSAHVPYVDMVADPEKIMSDYAEIGCKYIAIPYLTEEYRPGNPGFDGVIKNAAMLGEAAKKHGMTLLYHNHDFEFQKVGDKYALDILYSEVPAALLQTELDTCWVNVGGENPADYLRKYSGRSPVVHLKDFAGQKGGKMYALIGIDDKPAKEDSAGKFEFRPIGKGLQNIPEIISASADAGAEWLIVEQDQPSMGLTPMECARCSIDYLKSL